MNLGGFITKLFKCNVLFGYIAWTVTYGMLIYCLANIYNIYIYISYTSR